jgi:hypothetical protein
VDIWEGKDGMRDKHTVILGIEEGILIDLALSGLMGAGKRASVGAALPSDAALGRACREILASVEAARTDRQETTLAMIANSLEPAVA